MLRKYGISLDFNLFSVFDRVLQGVTIQDKEGKLVYANAQAAHLVGFKTAKAFLKANSDQVLSRFVLMNEKGKPLSPAELPGRKSLQTGEPQQLIVRFIVKETGEEYWSFVRAQPLFDPDKKVSGVINFFDDLTKIKKTENENKFLSRVSVVMSQSMSYESRLQSFANSVVPNFVDWCTVDVLDAHGKAVRIAAAHPDPAKVLLSKKLWQTYPPDPKAELGFYSIIKRGKPEIYPTITDLMLKAAAKDQQHLKWLRSLNLKSIAVIPLVGRGKKLGVLSFGTSESERRITETDLPFLQKLADRVALLADNARLYSALSRQMQQQKVIKNELEKSDEKFSSVFHNSTVGMIIFDGEGRVREVNSTMCQLLDCRPRTVLKKKVHYVIGIDENLVITSQLPTSDGKIEGITETTDYEGNNKTLAYSITNLAIPRFHLLTVRDITEQKIEERRREHFLTITSHELKSPLASIKSISQLMLRKLEKQDIQAAEHLSHIDRKVDLLARLVDDLLDVTRIRQGKLDFFYEIVDIEVLIRDVVKDILYINPEWQIMIKGKISHEVITDRGRFTQILRNLLSNSIKYASQTKKIVITLKEGIKKFKIEVRDFGQGILSAEQNKIFRLYYRSSQDGHAQGLGVGLYISSKIIRQMGGKLNLYSQPGKGSRFYFSLPYTPKSEKAAG